jgi:hypothetical protein
MRAEQASAGPYASYERIPAAQSWCYGSLGSKFPSGAAIGPPDPPQLLPMVSAPLGFITFNFMPQRLQLSNRTERLANEVVPALRKMT